MRAVAKRQNGAFKHRVEMGHHWITADEPEDGGGDDEGPSPQDLLAGSLASCTAITMELYAARKGWDIGDVEVDVDYEPAQRGSPTKFTMDVKLPKELPDTTVLRFLNRASDALYAMARFADEPEPELFGGRG